MKKCQVHCVELEKGKAPVFYGLPDSPPMDYLDAQKTLFPNSFLFVLGGCLIDDKTESVVKFCPNCRQAEKVWTGRGLK